MGDRVWRNSTTSITHQSNIFKTFLLMRDGKNWNKLWMELNGNYLKIFTDPTKDHKIKEINVKGMHLQENPNLQTYKKNCFELQSSNESFHFSASSQQQRDQWISYLMIATIQDVKAEEDSVIPEESHRKKMMESKSVDNLSFSINYSPKIKEAESSPKTSFESLTSIHFVHKEGNQKWTLSIGPLTTCADVLKMIGLKFPKADATLELFIEISEEGIFSFLAIISPSELILERHKKMEDSKFFYVREKIPELRSMSVPDDVGLVLKDRKKSRRAISKSVSHSVDWKMLQKTLDDIEEEEEEEATETLIEWKSEDLFFGEKVLLRRKLSYVVVKRKHIYESQFYPGTLFITNYQLFYVEDRNPKIPITSTPLATILKIKKEKKSTSDQYENVEVHCKDMRTLLLGISKQKNKRKFFLDKVMSYLPKSPSQAFAFSFKYNLQNIKSYFDGWKLYDPVADFKRVNIPDSRWRLSEVNSKYEISDTYPKIIAVPASVSDEVLKDSANFRSRGRIPACIWKHRNQATLIRSSQPLVGISRKASSEDQKLINAILATNPVNDKTFYIIDARPKVNAQANVLKGMGYELTNSDYQNCVIEFYNIANIHVMRDSLKKIKKMCESNVSTDTETFAKDLENTGWLEHIRRLLACSIRMVELIDKESTSVLSHCSDGWDRTSQVCAVAEMCLDPNYRTIAGFAIVIEKEFLAFGHKIAQRVGHDENMDNYKDKERAPIFLQFIDCVWQLTQQFPDYFEFNTKLLLFVMDQLFSCLFGNFLFNNPREREENELERKTTSIWTFVFLNISYFKNPSFQPFNEVLYPKTDIKNIKFWKQYYARYHFGDISETITPSLLLKCLKDDK